MSGISGTMASSTSDTPRAQAAGSHGTVLVAGAEIGARSSLHVIAGPCSVEGIEQFRETALAAKQAGASLLRGGAFKPRTSPYSFQGLGRAGLEIMREVSDELGMGFVTETMSPEDLPHVVELADMLQIGARNMSNRPLLEAAADSGRPVLLKRGIMATVDELLEMADFIVARGNERVILCERGSRTFEPSTRNSLDLAAVTEIHTRSDYPVVVDPSHGTGVSDLVLPVSLAAVAAGADGLIVEVHPDPPRALSDGSQSLRAADLGAFMDRVSAMAMAVGRVV